MSLLSAVPLISTVVLFSLLALTALFTSLVLWAQVGCIRGKPFKNPDGTKDDWREQKIFYGIAWADILVACPLSYLTLILVFVSPRIGFFLLGMVGLWFLWSNIMTTVTSLRFEKPKITLHWIIVFPLGAVIGFATIFWILVHFSRIFG